MAVAAPYAAPAAHSPALEKEMKEFAENAVSRAKSTLNERLPDLNANLTAEVLSGSPAQQIVRQAEAWEADLVVVGSHGYGLLERVFLGSVSDHVANHAPCSVLIVRPRSSFS